MITDPLFYLCAVPAVLLYGMAKGGFGGGIAVVAVPLMTLAVSPVTAAAILLPILVVMDFVAIWSFRGNWSRINLKYTLPGALAGIVVGAFTFRYLSEDAIRIMIGVISVAFCLNYYWNSGLKQKLLGTEAGEPDPKQPSPIRGNWWGSIAGFTSFGIHAGGPPISIYMLPLRLEKTHLMGTFAVFFTVVNLVKLIPYAWLGQFDASNLTTSLVLVPLAPVGVRLGYYLLHKVSEQLIYQLCYFFLAVVGAKLLWDGLTGTLA